MEHELLNAILRKIPQLTDEELQMLDGVVRQQRESAAAKDEELLVSREPDLSDLALKKI